jgi:lipid-A-disaccharide synthase
MRAMRQREPHWEFFGVGGPEMIGQGLQVTLPMSDFQVFGFTDILSKLPRLWLQFRQTRELILQRQPDAVILVDYPGFNLRLARSLRKAGYQGKIIQLICPTVWAWGKGRIDTLAANDDLLLAIFPFEPPLFAHTGLQVKFIGHPLVEKVAQHAYVNDWRAQCQIAPSSRTLALFPGSRPSEIRRLLPRQLQAARLLRAQDSELQVLISCADPDLEPAIKAEVQRAGLNAALVPKRFTYELMTDCRTALAKSGTVTLELALHNVPTVVIYETSAVNTWIARYVIRLKLPYLCIVNILCGYSVFLEWIRRPFTAEDLVEDLRKLHFEGPERTQCLEGCRKMQDALQTPSGRSPANEAACAIEELWQP